VRLLLLAILVAGASCGGDRNLHVFGDESAVGAKVFVDGKQCGVLVAERTSEVVLADSARGMRGVWGDASDGDTLLGPNVTSVSLRVPVTVKETEVMVIAVGGRMLRARLNPLEYNAVYVSFKRMRIKATTSED
jgi:hypothetical protein